ncbi:MAG TPA: glycosyltransferase [Thermoanaerobaculia bacterium]|nr:glycosyltransferase [Thermoanaerobaculia bacterium]
MLQLRHRALYAAFDRFPSRKGAAIHIGQFASTLFGSMGGGLLYVVGDESLPSHQIEGTIEIVRAMPAAENFLERTIHFGMRLRSLLGESGSALEICHFRDPWSGVEIVTRPHDYATVYEVNALPSIELPFSYPFIAPETLDKIRNLERICLEGADVIITPARTIRDRLLQIGVDAGKIRVIPNGADLPGIVPRPTGAPDRYILYFGALQPWQGFETLLRAFARLADLEDLRLVVCVSRWSTQAKRYRKFAAKLGVDERVLWFDALEEADLAPWRSHALLSVAPLRDCARNVEQGCAPLKILESLASGVPVVASDLPSVREIMTDGVEGRLVHPDRPGDLARTIRVLLEYPAERERMGKAARRRVEEDFTWTHARASLAALYEEVSGRHGAVPAVAEERG